MLPARRRSEGVIGKVCIDGGLRHPCIAHPSPGHTSKMSLPRCFTYLHIHIYVEFLFDFCVFLKRLKSLNPNNSHFWLDINIANYIEAAGYCITPMDEQQNKQTHISTRMMARVIMMNTRAIDEVQISDVQDHWVPTMGNTAHITQQKVKLVLLGRSQITEKTDSKVSADARKT